MNWKLGIVALTGLWASVALADGLPAPASRQIDFRQDVYPLLEARCFQCHQGRDASSGHRLDDRAEILGETTGTPLAMPGRSAGSRLIQVVAGLDDETVMPPKGARLSPAEVGALRAWIDQGLEWDESLLPPVLSETDHWAFQTVRRPEVPSPSAAEWVRNPIDAFVAQKHEQQGLAPAAEASANRLVRRMWLDLVGVPPPDREVPQETQLGDDVHRLAERLLASPRYGVRWGRHWLDVARWSETEGFESNHPRPFAWRYRDFVVDSLNEDKPFDLFVRQQIAGDEMTPYRDENLIATGFLAAARLSSNEEDKWLQMNDVLVDVVNATGAAFLGLTVNCAQCHNHKFDPITIRDYYRLQGFFVKGQPLNVALQSDRLRRTYEESVPAEYEAARQLKQAIFEAARSRLIAEAKQSFSPEMLKAVETPADERTVAQELLARKANLKFQSTPKGIEKHIPAEDRKLYDELKKKVERIKKRVVEPQTFAFYSPVTSPHKVDVLPMLGFYPPPYDPPKLERTRPYLRIRGDVHNIGPKLEPGVPAVFNTVFEFSAENARTGSRLALADWLTDPRHPLTARVWVNRIWHYHFGRGLVDTPGDFGVRTARPPHAELLDWLAAELISSGWSTKHIHRLIVTSSTYRQSSRGNPVFRDVDPDNSYLWHWAPRRLEAEAIRDAMLAVTGELDQRMDGASVPVNRVKQSTRSSLYLFQNRGRPPEVQKLFDGPSEASESCARRHTSTTPLQSLYLLNSRFVLDRAEWLARSIARTAGDDRDRQIESAFQRVLGRPPHVAEAEAARAFWQSYSASGSQAALVHFCQALFNVNEFVYIE